MAPRKRPPAPGEYDGRYRDAVVEFMGRGYSLTAFAGEIGVSRATLDRWVIEHSPFARAVERAQARRARVLEDRLLAATGAGAFGAHMEALKTAAPDEWSPKVRADTPRRAAAPDLTVVDLPDNGRG